MGQSKQYTERCKLCDSDLTPADIFYNEFICFRCVRNCTKSNVKMCELKKGDIFRMGGSSLIYRVTAIDSVIHYRANASATGGTKNTNCAVIVELLTKKE